MRESQTSGRPTVFHDYRRAKNTVGVKIVSDGLLPNEVVLSGKRDVFVDRHNEAASTGVVVCLAHPPRCEVPERSPSCEVSIVEVI